jgi:hypothetical protein
MFMVFKDPLRLMASMMQGDAVVFYNRPQWRGQGIMCDVPNLKASVAGRL